MPKRSPILQALSDPTKNFLAFFFIGVLLFGLFSNEVTVFFQESFSPWLQKRLNIPLKPETFRLLVVSVPMGIILLAIYFTDLANWVRRSLARFGIADAIVPDTAKVTPLAETCRGLVVIMSPKEDSPAEFAIRHHWNKGQEPHLEYCWIICTPESAEFARRLEQQLIEECIGEHITFYHGSCSVEDPIQPVQKLSLTVGHEAIHDPDYVLHLVNGVYAHAESLGLSEADIIVDITGGTKPLGVGAFLACARPERRLEYITTTGESRQLLEIRVAYRLKPIR
ncbi:MAG: hypothetical protein ACFBSF_13580 [Leptolyngbyaceae cyanobacterium]